MRKDQKADYFNSISNVLMALGVLIFFIIIIIGTVLYNYFEINYNPRFFLLIALGLFGTGAIVWGITRISFPYYHLIKRALKPGFGYDRRISFLTKSIIMEPTVMAHLERAKARLISNSKKGSELGLEDCNWVLDKVHDHAEAHLVKAYFLGELGRKKEAMESINRSIYLKPTFSTNYNQNPYYSRGWWNFENEDYYDAGHDFRKSIELKEKRQTNIFLLAKTEEKLKNFKRAMECYSKFLKQVGEGKREGNNSAQVAAFFRLTNILIDMGKLEEAKKLWHKYKESKVYRKDSSVYSFSKNDSLTQLNEDDVAIYQKIKEKIDRN